MREENIKQIYNLFIIRIIEISMRYGASEQYIQGQLNEASHQTELQLKKLHRSSKHGV